MLKKNQRKLINHTLLIAGLISTISLGAFFNLNIIQEAQAQNVNLNSAKYSSTNLAAANVSDSPNNSNNTNNSNSNNANPNTNTSKNSSVVTTAQNNSNPLDAQTKVKVFAKNPTNFTFEVSTKLENDISSQNYADFFTTIESANVSSEYYEKFLLSKTDDGIAPVYWLLANYYTHAGKIADAKKWFYVAIITTQQDQNLCLDKSSRVATNQLIHAFPDTIDMDRKNTQFNQKSAQDAIFFIKNLKTRAFPGWVCNFGQDPVKPGMSPVLPHAQWQKEYQRILDDFTRNLDN